MLRGTVSSFDARKGFGFVQPAEAGAEGAAVFFHRSQLPPDLPAPFWSNAKTHQKFVKISFHYTLISNFSKKSSMFLNKQNRLI